LTPSDTPPDPDEILCFCSGTKRREIEKLFREGYDQQAISRKTGALSGCGGCEWDIEQFLKELEGRPGDGSKPDAQDCSLKS
jgi:bacterioferritin-associated ferredoxin